MQPTIIKHQPGSFTANFGKITIAASIHDNLHDGVVWGIAAERDFRGRGLLTTRFTAITGGNADTPLSTRFWLPLHKQVVKDFKTYLKLTNQQKGTK